MGDSPKKFNNPFAKALATTAKTLKNNKIETAPTAAKKNTAPKAKTGDENDLFSQAMSGVKPMRGDSARVEPAKTLEKKNTNDDLLALLDLQSLVGGDGPLEESGDEEIQAGVAPGVNHDLLRRLKNGDFAVGNSLDLHGQSQEEAQSNLRTYIAQNRRLGERCVLVITGRGKNSPTGSSVLKESLPRWLSRPPIANHVLAFCTAQSQDGGPGAFYVLLRRTNTRP